MLREHHGERGRKTLQRMRKSSVRESSLKTNPTKDMVAGDPGRSWGRGLNMIIIHCMEFFKNKNH